MQKEFFLSPHTGYAYFDRLPYHPILLDNAKIVPEPKPFPDYRAETVLYFPYFPKTER